MNTSMEDEPIRLYDEGMFQVTNATNLTTTPGGHLERNDERHWATILDNATVIIMTVNLVILMFGMGAATSIWEIWENVKRPWACVIGMICQFFALPAFGYLLSVLLNLSPTESLGVLVLTCSPGGALSILFTYWVDGDIALSILMTTTSCLLAFGGMPLNLWIYTRFFTDETMKIPYLKVLTSMAFVTGPTVLGMALRHVTKKWATIISQVCSILGWAGALACGAFVVVIYWDVIATTSVNLVIGAGIVPVFGFCLSYICIKIFCMKHHICRTVGIETGCQNIVVATSVALISFADKEIRGKMIVFPALYGMFQLAEVLLFIIFYQFYKFIHRDDVTEEIVENVIDTKILQRVPLPTPRSNSKEFLNTNGLFKRENNAVHQYKKGLYSPVMTNYTSDTEHIYNESAVFEGSFDHEDSKDGKRTESFELQSRGASSQKSRSSYQMSISASSLTSHQTESTVGQASSIHEPGFAWRRTNRRNEETDWTRNDLENPYSIYDQHPYEALRFPHQMESDRGPNPRHLWDPITDLIDQRSRPQQLPLTPQSNRNIYGYGWREESKFQGQFYQFEEEIPETPRSPSLNDGYHFRTFAR